MKRPEEGMILYHGSYCIVEKLLLPKQRPEVLFLQTNSLDMFHFLG